MGVTGLARGAWLQCGLKRSQLPSRYDAKELEEHIEMLHTYNELKDVAQHLMGLLGRQGSRSSGRAPMVHHIPLICFVPQLKAQRQGITTKAVHEHFGLALDD